jgi:cell division protein FtsB
VKRLHARRKGKPAPRTYSAATGLAEITPVARSVSSSVEATDAAVLPAPPHPLTDATPPERYGSLEPQLPFESFEADRPPKTAKAVKSARPQKPARESKPPKPSKAPKPVRALKPPKPAKAPEPARAEATSAATRPSLGTGPSASSPPASPEHLKDSASGASGTPEVITAGRAPKGLAGGRTRREQGQGRIRGSRTSAGSTRPTPPARPDVPKGRGLTLPRLASKGGSGQKKKKSAGRKQNANENNPTKRSLIRSFWVTKRRDRKTKQERNPVTPIDRRRRIPVALAGVFAAAVLATSFPISAIFSQHRQLSAASAQLHELQVENRLLAEQQHQLNSKVAINEMAREDFQMVSPGQTLFDVLPPKSLTGRSVRGTTTGDPANQPLVSPAQAPDLSPQPGLPQPIPSSAAASPSKPTPSAAAPAPVKAPSTFWGRVANTLEFWN